jgi:elongation factor P
MASPNEIKKGVVLKDQAGLWLVTEFQHVNPGKGAAFVRSRIKNLQTGKSLERTYKTSESVEIVEVEHRRMQFLYKDQTGCTFMDTNTYEQFTLPEDQVGDQVKFLKDGMEVMVSLYEGSPISVELPRKMTFKVIQSPDVVAGNTASGGNLTKEVTVEGDIKIRAPMFIKEGEDVIVNTETGEYVERA